ncbi:MULTISPECIES: hypothetical protein [Brucella/Ochrobactrum group]|uniref:hypothetical protein n=1 Tax=Brucella/Ochrobactrum group TaxID=2826938 RepID=UPI001C04A9EA|nr:hypothetical protein [Brucella sp. NBRC 12950]QWK80362.1 hypothetical protein KMS41_21635 [Ochrobactrum sp. BTU1]GLU29520.1 hypothetical protein Brsp01_47530 [Brucella sp. NBRC 12950]
MGSGVLNFNMTCDFATPNKDSFVELHVEFPLTYMELRTLQGWLENKDWDAAENYLSEKYPEHRCLLSGWLAACRNRSEASDMAKELASVI